MSSANVTVPPLTYVCVISFFPTYTWKSVLVKLVVSTVKSVWYASALRSSITFLTIVSCAASNVSAAVMSAVVVVTPSVAGGVSTTSPTIVKLVPFVSVIADPPKESASSNEVPLGVATTQYFLFLTNPLAVVLGVNVSPTAKL